MESRATPTPTPGQVDTPGSNGGVFAFDAGAASSPQVQLIADSGDDASRLLGTLPEVVVRPPAKPQVGETEMESVGGAFFGRLAFEVADTLADSIPFVGQAKGLGELLTGKNALGEDIGVLGRVGGAANLIPGGKKITQIAGAIGGGVKKLFGALSGVGKKVDNAADGVARMGKTTRRMADAVDDVAPRVTPFRDNSLSHIFRPKHNLIDTPANRQLIQSVADDAANFVGKNQHGTQIFAKTQADGSQIWVYVRDGQIFDAGRNLIPRILP